MPSTVKAWVWQCSDCLQECVPIRAESRCMCGHRLKEHEEGHKCSKKSCTCPKFSFVVAEGSWILRCRCKHKHIEHCPASYSCKKPACSCTGFVSPWVCNCDHPWASHQQIMVERQVLRISDMLAQQQDSYGLNDDSRGRAAGSESDQPMDLSARNAAAASAERQQLQGLALDSSTPASPGAIGPPAAAGVGPSSSSNSRLAALKANRLRRQNPGDNRAPGAGGVGRVESQMQVTVAPSSAAASVVTDELVIVEEDLQCDINRWDLLQRGRWPTDQ